MVFPNIQIPDLRRQNAQISAQAVKSSPLWDFAEGEFVKTPEGRIINTRERLRIVEQKVRAALMTGRGLWPIYSHRYGSEIHKIIGWDPSYIEARLPEMIRETISATVHVDRVTVTGVVFEDTSLRFNLEIEDLISGRSINQNITLDARDLEI